MHEEMCPLLQLRRDKHPLEEWEYLRFKDTVGSIAFEKGNPFALRTLGFWVAVTSRRHRKESEISRPGPCHSWVNLVKRKFWIRRWFSCSGRHVFRCVPLLLPAKICPPPFFLSKGHFVPQDANNPIRKNTKVSIDSKVRLPCCGAAQVCASFPC